MIPWIFIALVLFLLSFPAITLLSSILAPTQVIFIGLFWYVLVSSYVFVNILIWLFNVGIITSERVIDVNYYNVLDKEVTETSNEDIADVSFNLIGFIPSYFDYGEVFVQSPGSEQRIDFLKIPHPSEVTSIISQLAIDHSTHE